MDTELSESKIMQALDWSYDKAINGVAGLDSASELAESYMGKDCSDEDKVNSLIRWQNTKAGTSGFLTGLGGIMTMAITLPANITSVIYVQIRMIAAIAYIGGHDVKDDRVKSLVYVCLLGNGAKDILKDIGVAVGSKLTTNLIKNISGKTIVAINQKVGFRLLTKFGEKGLINLGKAIPAVGGVIGATFDSISTNVVGNKARDIFINEGNLMDSENNTDCSQSQTAKQLIVKDSPESNVTSPMLDVTQGFGLIKEDKPGWALANTSVTAAESVGNTLIRATGKLTNTAIIEAANITREVIPLVMKTISDSIITVSKDLTKLAETQMTEHARTQRMKILSGTYDKHVAEFFKEINTLEGKLDSIVDKDERMSLHQNIIESKKVIHSLIDNHSKNLKNLNTSEYSN